MILELAVPGGQISSTVRNSGRVGQVMTRLEDAGRLGTAIRYLSRADDLRRAPGRIASYHSLRILSRSKGLTEAGARRIVEEAPTAAARYRVASAASRLPSGFLRQLTPDEATRLGQFLARYGEAGRELLSANQDVRRLLVKSDTLDEQSTRAILRAHARGDVESSALGRLVDGIEEMDEVHAVRLTDEGVEIDGRLYNTDTSVTYTTDGANFYTTRSHVDTEADLADLTPQQVGGDVVEGDVANDIIEARDGHEIVYGQHKAGNAQGIDLIVEDTSGPGTEYVVVEVKFTTRDESIDLGDFGSREFRGRETDQFTHDWIRGSYREDVVGGGAENLPNGLGSAIRNRDYRRELFLVHDGSTSRIVSQSVASLSDEINMYRSNGVTE